MLASLEHIQRLKLPIPFLEIGNCDHYMKDMKGVGDVFGEKGGREVEGNSVTHPAGIFFGRDNANVVTRDHTHARGAIKNELCK